MFSTLFDSPATFFLSVLCLLVVITIHEFSHAIAADWLGDPTPRLQGRISLNPLVHLDPIGTVMMLLVGFGWGKPVQFDPYNLKDPRKDAALISLAGPGSNFIMAIILSILIKLFTIVNFTGFSTMGYGLVEYFFYILIYYNVVLGVFNLLPIHPLDGFKIVGGILSSHRAREWYELERYGFIFLLALIVPLGRSSMLDMVLRPIVQTILHLLIPGGN